MLSDRERSNLLSDVLSLARAGQLSYNIALDLTLYLRLETDLLPWDTVVTTFEYITNQLYGDPDFALWQVRLARSILILSSVKSSLCQATRRQSTRH